MAGFSVRAVGGEHARVLPDPELVRRLYVTEGRIEYEVAAASGVSRRRLAVVRSPYSRCARRSSAVK